LNQKCDLSTQIFHLNVNIRRRIIGLLFGIPGVILLFTFNWALRNLRELKEIESMITDPAVLKGNLREQKPIKIILFITTILILALLGLIISVFIVHTFELY